jgi:hypothetical protein
MSKFVFTRFQGSIALIVSLFFSTLVKEDVVRLRCLSVTSLFHLLNPLGGPQHPQAWLLPPLLVEFCNHPTNVSYLMLLFIPAGESFWNGHVTGEVATMRAVRYHRDENKSLVLWNHVARFGRVGFEAATSSTTL